jgi:hypothetical protein
MGLSLALALTEHLGGLLLVGAAIAFYIASRAASDAMSQAGATSPIRHALAQWASIAAVCFVAVWLDHAEIAVGVIFSTAVAALSLHLGVAIATTPHPVRARRVGRGFEVVVEAEEDAGDATETAPAASAQRFGAVRGRRAWAMVLPVGVLALMAGFSGKLTLLHALLFTIQGLFVMMVWKERASHPAPSAARLSGTSRAQFALAIVLAVIGAFCAIYGAVRMSEETGIMSTGLIASAALGPLLILPMIGSASLMASQGQVQTVAGASVVMVLLNLCLLLPLVIVGWHVREQYFVPSTTPQALAAPVTRPTTAATTTPTAATRPVATTSSTSPSDEEPPEDFADEAPIPDDMPRVLSFPIAVWRIDTVLLILLGLILLPVALNLWDLRRSEGILLIAIYACYLIGTTFLGRRW